MGVLTRFPLQSFLQRGSKKGFTLQSVTQETEKIMIRFLVILLPLFFLVSSCKKRTRGTMTVIRGCEGSYLRVDDLDYTIGNEKKLKDFPNGTIVDAVFVRNDKCYSEGFHCAMVHDHPMAEGSYKITAIKLHK